MTVIHVDILARDRRARFRELPLPDRAQASVLESKRDAMTVEHAPVPPSPTSTSLNAGTPSGVVCPGNACKRRSIDLRCCFAKERGSLALPLRCRS